MAELPFNENAGSIDFEEPSQNSTATTETLVLKALDGLSFPLTKSELLERAGQRRLNFPNGQSVAIFDLLVAVNQREFESATAVAKAVIHPSFSVEP